MTKNQDMSEKLTQAEAGNTIHLAVWTILREECGAAENMPADFVFNWPECREYRFIGAIGSGGKVWDNDGRWYVTNYPETTTPERDAMMDRANERLTNLYKSQD